MKKSKFKKGTSTSNSVEIDISGRVEDTARDTVIALSNHKKHSIKLKAKTKRDLVILLRKQGRSGKAIYVQMYVAVLYLSLKNFLKQISGINVDIEYRGHEKEIKQRLIQHFNKNTIRIDPNILDFKYIGKKSSAHSLAISTYRGLVKENKTVTMEEMLSLLMQTKRSGAAK